MEPINPDRLLYLISGHINRRLSDAEEAEFQHWLSLDEANRQLIERFNDPSYLEQQLATWDPGRTEAALAKVTAMIGEQRSARWKSIYGITGAVAIVILSMAIYFASFKNKKAENIAGDAVYTVASTIAPGANRALLTLEDGRVIDLSAVTTGEVLHGPGLTIRKDTDGTVSYFAAADPMEQQGFHTIQTPRGGQYRVRLPDGTDVLLNAASSLRYSKTMNEDPIRKVELTGEAYFEVTKSKVRPFIVKTTTQQVTVLGTHFNVNSYINESRTVTTLAEGSVKVASGKSVQLLKPGQQSLVSDGNIKVQAADLEQALAWKNGEMLFRSASIREILKQAERWYNIDVAYQGHIPDESITGGISRKDKLDVLLRVLQLSGVTYEITKDGDRFKLTIKGD